MSEMPLGPSLREAESSGLFELFALATARAPETTVVERPPPGPAQGVLAAPAWLVWSFSGGLVLAALIMLWRSRRGRKS